MFPYASWFVFLLHAFSSIQRAGLLFWGVGCRPELGSEVEASCELPFSKLISFPCLGFPGMWPAKNTRTGPNRSLRLWGWFQCSLQTLQPRRAADHSCRHELGQAGECPVLLVPLRCCSPMSRSVLFPLVIYRVFLILLGCLKLSEGCSRPMALHVNYLNACVSESACFKGFACEQYVFEEWCLILY